MDGNKSKSSSYSIFSKTIRSKDDDQIRVTPSRFSSRQLDSARSLSNFLAVESGCSLTPSLSSPLLAIHSNASFSDIERDIPTVDSGFLTTNDGGEDAEPDGTYEGEELCSDSSDLVSLSPNVISNLSNEDILENASDYHSILTFTASTPAIDKVSRGNERTYVYSSKKMREHSKRKLSNWYQVKRESFVKSYRDKLNHFRKIFADTPVDTERFLVDYSCALVKNKNGIPFLGRIYITDKWICFHSKILSELKLHIAVDDIDTVSRAKTARFIPNAIEITLKSDDERYFFTSFYSRERTFAFIKKVCENNRSGGVANMEELLCQVQDVYGDECLTVLDFADGDDEAFFPSNQDDRVTSTSELNEISAINSPQDSPNSSGLVTTSSRRPQSRYNSRGGKRHIPCPSTDDEALSPRPNSPPGSTFSSILAPNTTVPSLSSGDLTEGSDSATNSIKRPEDEAKGIEMNYTPKKRGTFESSGRPHRNSSHPPVLYRKPDSAGQRRSSSSPTKSDNEDDLVVDPGFGEKFQVDAVSCGSGHQHMGRTYAEADINVSVDALFAFLFTDSLFFDSFCERRGTFDVQQDQWPSKPWPTSDETLQRNISYILSLKQRFCPQTSRAYESQVILLGETRPGLRYVIDATVRNESVPFCNSFHATTRYCLLRRSDTTSHLLITAELIFDRPLFFGAKTIVENASRCTMTENFTELVDQLTKTASHLSERERITGGCFAQPHRSQLARTVTDASRRNNKDDGSGETGSGDADKISKDITPNSNSPNSVTAAHQSLRGLSIPQVLFCTNQQSDGRWLFMAAISLGLCVLLSMFYNRYQNVERITADHLEFTARAAVRPGSTPAPGCCDELDSIRSLLDSVSGVLSQIRTTLDLLERRLDNLSSRNM